MIKSKLKATTFLFVVFFLLAVNASVLAAPLPDKPVELPRRSSAKNLLETSAIVVYGRFDTEHESKTLRRRVGNGTLVNFEQNFHVYSYFSGNGPEVLEVLSTGIEPMPEADDERNVIYPGPMAEGEYICFLVKVNNAYYALNGRWQGAYPLHNGETIALEHAGFPELGNLTVEQFKNKIRTL